jgi:hypothetical protein
MYSISARDQISHPCKTTDKIMIVCVLILKYLDRRQEEKYCEHNDSKISPNLIYP